MERETFSHILQGYFSERGSLRQFIKDNYPSDDLKTKYRSIKRYLDGDRVPSFPNAKVLLGDMGLKYDNDTILEILNYSNQEKENRYKEEALVSGITINYKDILKESHYSTDEKVVLVQGSMAILNCDTAKEYIIELINSDLEELFIRVNEEK